MRTYKEVLEDGIQLLETAAIEEARLDAWLLLEYTADITRAWYYAHMDDGLDAKQKNVIERCAQNVLSISRCSILPGVHILWDTNFVWMNVYLYRDRIQRCLWKKRFLA